MDREKTLAEEAGLPDSWHPVDAEPIVPSKGAPTNPNPMGPFFGGPIAPILQHDTTFVGTKYGSHNIASIPLMPVSPAGSASQNAAIKSSAAAVVPAASSADDDLVNINLQTGTTYTVQPSDLNTIISLSNNAGGTVFLPSINAGGGNFYQITPPAASTPGPVLIPITNQAGNMIVVVAKSGTSGVSPLVTDSNGNTYHAVCNAKEATGGGVYAFLFYAYNVVGGANVISITKVAGGTFVIAQAAEYRGMPTVASLDQAGANGLNNPIVTPTIVTGVPNALCTAWFIKGTGAAVFTSGAGWTLRTNNNGTSLVEDRIVPAIGTSITGTTAPASMLDESVNLIASFATAGQQAPTTFPVGWFCWIENTGTGSFSLDPQGVEIDGSTTPVTLASNTGLFLVFDGTDWLTERGLGSSGSSSGGTNKQTVNYLALTADNGKLISMNGSSLTLTLPAAPPSATWFIAVENIATSNLTVARNGLNIDGSASNLTVPSNQGLFIYTDGTNYFTVRGLANSPTSSASVNLTAQGANVAASTLYSVPASSTGLYRVSVYMIVSRAGTTSTLPDSRIKFTDQDSSATGITIQATTGLTGNTTSTFVQASYIVNAKAGTNIQYDIGQVTAYASTGGTSMQFAYRARVEYLG